MQDLQSYSESYFGLEKTGDFQFSLNHFFIYQVNVSLLGGEKEERIGKWLFVAQRLQQKVRFTLQKCNANAT